MIVWIWYIFCIIKMTNMQWDVSVGFNRHVSFLCVTSQFASLQNTKKKKKKPSLVIHGCALHEMCFVDRDQMKWILTEDMQKDILIFTKGVPE